MKDEKQLNALAIVVHTSAGLLNALIAIYNGQRGNRFRSGLHSALVLYEVHCVWNHIKE